MKKSDLISEIAEAFATHQAIAMTSGNYQVYLAELAIKIAEKAGMLAPTRTHISRLGEAHGFPNKSWEINEWEQE